MSHILVGTTSWTEKTLLESGRFYPPGVLTAEARLRLYATQFPVVEVDSSYYGLPSARNASLWPERTPDGFVFDVKAFRLFTQHQPLLPGQRTDERARIAGADEFLRPRREYASIVAVLHLTYRCCPVGSSRRTFRTYPASITRRSTG
jgi:uncharacterized protein YecE (DUF72 family)